MLDEQGTKNFGIYLDRTLRQIRLDMGRRLKEHGVDITPEQWIILSRLYKKNGQSQSEIGDASFKNAPTVSRIIDLLCKKGLTERRPHPEDRRRHDVFLTETGKKIVEQALPAILESRKKGWQGLDDDDFHNFLRIMDRIFQNLSE